MSIGAAARVRIRRVFPFQLDTEPVGWALVARVVLAFTFVGSIVVQVVCFLRTASASASLDRCDVLVSLS
ncbi:hypothetical protein [Couchioplanes azureus]|uniref:hypothetical protein n=1 Tax=Couchioplanes caeruleus TaxID=56438 RepID=UPI00166FE11D|nr:hypothetical protein [Couchioplanes caeruleus]GGQ84666.1 hypothetical protein GCM10010166_63580 [Couchioplanes caeruleus subsp. azureus]